MAPRIAKRVASTKDVLRWFAHALDKDDAKPTPHACERLAREFQILVNRQNNEAKDPQTPIRDVSPAEFENIRLRTFTDAADRLLFEADELERHFGNHHWTDADGAVSLDDIRGMLARIGAFPRYHATPSQGRPKEVWHGPAKAFARLTKETLKATGYTRSLSAVDANSAIPIIGAAAISWAYGFRLAAAGFASAMRKRNRTKKAREPISYDAMFPSG